MFGHIPDPKRIKLMKSEVFKDKIKPNPKIRMIRKAISEIARSGWTGQPDPEEQFHVPEKGKTPGSSGWSGSGAGLGRCRHVGCTGSQHCWQG